MKSTSSILRMVALTVAITLTATSTIAYSDASTISSAFVTKNPSNAKSEAFVNTGEVLKNLARFGLKPVLNPHLRDAAAIPSSIHGRLQVAPAPVIVRNSSQIQMKQNRSEVRSILEVLGNFIVSHPYQATLSALGIVVAVEFITTVIGHTLLIIYSKYPSSRRVIEQADLEAGERREMIGYAVTLPFYIFFFSLVTGLIVLFLDMNAQTLGFTLAIYQEAALGAWFGSEIVYLWKIFSTYKPGPFILKTRKELSKLTANELIEMSKGLDESVDAEFASGAQAIRELVRRKDILSLVKITQGESYILSDHLPFRALARATSRRLRFSMQEYDWKKMDLLVLMKRHPYLATAKNFSKILVPMIAKTSPFSVHILSQLRFPAPLESAPEVRNSVNVIEHIRTVLEQTQRNQAHVGEQALTDYVRNTPRTLSDFVQFGDRVLEVMNQTAVTIRREIGQERFYAHYDDWGMETASGTYTEFVPNPAYEKEVRTILEPEIIAPSQNRSELRKITNEVSTNQLEPSIFKAFGFGDRAFLGTDEGILITREAFYGYDNPDLIAPALKQIAKTLKQPIAVVVPDGIGQGLIAKINVELSEENKIIPAKTFQEAALSFSGRHVSSIRIVAAASEKGGSIGELLRKIGDVYFVKPNNMQQLFSVLGISEEIVNSFRSELRLEYSA